MDDLREKVARALAYHDGVPNGRWYGTAEEVFEAIRESGYRIVPVEPTEGMIQAACRSYPMFGWDGFTERQVRELMIAIYTATLTAYGQKGE